MSTWRLATCPLLAVVLLLLIHSPALGSDPSQLEVTPKVVDVGLTFGGADILIEGTTLPGAQVLVKVSAQPETVKLSKKGKVMGIFWMTTERAVVENMPTFHVLSASQPVETLLSKEDQIRIGADRECTSIMSQATVTADTPERNVLPADQSAVYVAGLRDIYIKSGRYVPCVSCHQMRAGDGSANSGAAMPMAGAVRLENGKWNLRFRLPPDAPLGNYTVEAYYIKGMQASDPQTADFEVRKAGLVEFLGTMAARNAPAYGLLTIVVAVFVGLGIGFIFPKSRH